MYLREDFLWICDSENAMPTLVRLLQAARVWYRIVLSAQYSVLPVSVSHVVSEATTASKLACERNVMYSMIY